MLKIRLRQSVSLGALPLLLSPLGIYSQAQAPARQLGTVKAIEGNTVTLTTTVGADVTVTVAPDAQVLQLPPGSTDLKSATPSRLEDVAVGDRILVSGSAGAAAGTLAATRVILMVTDGAPHDVDVTRDAYLVEDARLAVQHARRKGIRCFCVALDAQADSYVRRIFGVRNYLIAVDPNFLQQRMKSLFATLLQP